MKRALYDGPLSTPPRPNVESLGHALEVLVHSVFHPLLVVRQIRALPIVHQAAQVA